MKRPVEITFAQAINEGLHQAMAASDEVICYGLGIDDPKRIFGTTVDLKERFGKRVFDMPLSENAMTGIGVGAAIGGLRPVMVHQRLDFFLLAMDQLVNSAAKWHYMFGGKRSVPLTIRLIIGRGWGQGPTHSQNLQAWFAHIPGLKVVMPSSPADAKGLLRASIDDNNPVVFLEHRWLHQQMGEVPESPDFRVPLSECRVMEKGVDVTIVASSYLTIEALHAVRRLREEGVQAELIDLRTIKPLDWPTLLTSVKKTGRLLALDSGAAFGSVAGTIVARVASDLFSHLRAAPLYLTMPDVPEPTAYELTREFYFGAPEIAAAAWKMVKGEERSFPELEREGHHDVPGQWFAGPF
ncbi:MAG: transketolase C-terminal domain-containing protein [Alphaproteobacteria bacterium]|nr:transketolase C-terminal domain-containing protein [Alphaproteobacteria bacterium]